jgi:hypothetical protein
MRDREASVCPGCGGSKTKRSQLCVGCRRRAIELGKSVITHVAAPAAPFVARTSRQNTILHGRLRELAQLESPGIERDALWEAERTLKRWACARASIVTGREISSSTELSELEMERLLDFLADVLDQVKAGEPRPR